MKKRGRACEFWGRGLGHCLPRIRWMGKAIRCSAMGHVLSWERAFTDGGLAREGEAGGTTQCVDSQLFSGLEPTLHPAQVAPDG